MLLLFCNLFASDFDVGPIHFNKEAKKGWLLVRIVQKHIGSRFDICNRQGEGSAAFSKAALGHNGDERAVIRLRFCNKDVLVLICFDRFIRRFAPLGFDPADEFSLRFGLTSGVRQYVPEVSCQFFAMAASVWARKLSMSIASMTISRAKSGSSVNSLYASSDVNGISEPSSA